MTNPIGPDAPGMNDNDFDEAGVLAKLEELRIEHRDLDAAIARLGPEKPEDELVIRRLKKRKLLLKDRITTLERIAEPDELA